MKFKLNLFLGLALALFMSACGSENAGGNGAGNGATHRTESGAEYITYQALSQDVPNPGDYVFFEVQMRNDSAVLDGTRMRGGQSPRIQIPKEKIEVEGVKVYESAEELYANNQYVSLHIPANDKTKNSINYNLLSKMPASATLVNTARKEVVDENDLVKLLEERSDFKYVSDIAPTNATELLEKFPAQCFFTPKKMGAQTAEANINAGVAAANQIVNFIENGDTTFKVNK